MHNVKKPNDLFDSFDSDIDSPPRKKFQPETIPIFNKKKQK